MRKRTYVILAILVLLGMFSLVILKSYSLEIVHAAVQNAVIQKAPSSFPEQKIREAFSRSYQNAISIQSKEEYIAELNAISHQLEKVQFLNEEEVEIILRKLSKE
jgi:hypothetical protein